ncbi:MAG: DUF4286 family protein [Cyclobacteriaceae bacterium]|nr:DUF4286 family protein [Cyclobacteriaceae bacterium HetDA_MAG_MS6]
MVLYNVTVNIEESIQPEWIAWMKEIHIPDVLSTGLFYESKFLKLLNENPDVEGITYAIQYLAKNMADVEHYLDKFALGLQQKHLDRFGDKFVAFRTVLEEVP